MSTLIEALTALAKQGRVDLAKNLVRARDNKPAGKIQFSTRHGDYVAVIGPEHTRNLQRPVELYWVDPADGIEMFRGYAYPPKMRTVKTNEDKDAASKALQILDQKGMLPEIIPPRKMSGRDRDRLRDRIRKHFGSKVRSIYVLSLRDYGRLDEHTMDPGTLLVIQHPNGMWLARFIHRSGISSSGRDYKAPLQAVREVMRKAP